MTPTSKPITENWIFRGVVVGLLTAALIVYGSKLINGGVSNVIR